MVIDRSHISRLLAKSLAYACVGKLNEAQDYAIRLVVELKKVGLLPREMK